MLTFKHPALVALIALSLTAAPTLAHQGKRGQAPQTLSTPRPFALPAQLRAEPPIKATPRANCGPGSRPEPGMQGRVPKDAVESGAADAGYQCNMSVIGRSGSTGGFRVFRYVDKAGHECAYYDTTLLFPTNVTSLSAEPTGVAVLDMSNPAKPVRTGTLLTPAMQTPHESVNLSEQRGILAAVMGNAAAAPGGIDVYDVSKDCRNPEVMAAGFPATPFGHESGISPDGLTFYPTSIATNETTAVDISNPRLPRTLVTAAFNTHGMSVSDDGRRGYLAAGDGLIIVDLSEVQDRKPNPQIREISRLVWSNITIPQVAIPVTIKGKPYVVEVDEFSADEGGSTTAHGSRVGAARIIDISDEKKPFVVSNIRLDVHQPENRAAIADDPGAQNPVQGYAGHYCNVPKRKEPGIFACSMIASGLRVFDIRDAEKPKELGYFVSPPSTISASGGPVIDERSNWAMSQPTFAPERGEIWYTDGNSGFYALKMTNGTWPFTTAGPDSCVDSKGLKSVTASPTAGGGVRLGFTRRLNNPVRIDVTRVGDRRRVLGQRTLARFDNLSKGLAWNGVTNRGGKRAAPDGTYIVTFSMLKGGKRIDARRVVLRRQGGRFTRRPASHRRENCGLLRVFKLRRPIFGGKGNFPLRVGYRLREESTVTVTITRGGKVIKKVGARKQPGGKTLKVVVPSAGLKSGDYRVKIDAKSPQSRVRATLTARRF